MMSSYHNQKTSTQTVVKAETEGPILIICHFFTTTNEEVEDCRRTTIFRTQVKCQVM